MAVTFLSVLRLKLEENGSYSGECQTAEAETLTNELDDDGKITCPGQIAKLVKIGLLIPTAQILSPLLGLFVDKFGPKRTAQAQAIVLLAGLGLVLLAVFNPLVQGMGPLLYVGYGLVAVGRIGTTNWTRTPASIAHESHWTCHPRRSTSCAPTRRRLFPTIVFASASLASGLERASDWSRKYSVLLKWSGKWNVISRVHYIYLSIDLPYCMAASFKRNHPTRCGR
jgi:hypothetical protein